MRDHASDIRQLREQSNAAISARDASWVTSYMADDVVVSVAGGPVLRGRDANRDAFAEQFADTSFNGYVRTPEQIDVSADGASAHERGVWVGRWRTRTGVHEPRGHYTAEWRCGAMGWQIARETFRDR